MRCISQSRRKASDVNHFFSITRRLISASDKSAYLTTRAVSKSYLRSLISFLLSDISPFRSRYFCSTAISSASVLLSSALIRFFYIGIGHLTIGEIVLIKIIIRLFLDQFSKLRLILPQQLLSSSDNIPLFCKIFVNNDRYRKQITNNVFGG